MRDKQRLLKFSEYLGYCSREALAYGQCVATNAQRIKKDDCRSEFDKLITCFKKNQPSNRIARKMKVKRLKRAARILTFYRFNFGYSPPYSVLLDGTFCQAALQFKINLREQMPKYLANTAEMFVTDCVLNELNQLGKPLHGALVICQQFRIAKCLHKQRRTASDCIAHLARRSRKRENTKYLVATQDAELAEKLRNVEGVPLMSIRYNTILLEKPSEQSKVFVANKPVEEMERVKELKMEILGPQERRKKRKAKGPNPLSCKKKQKRSEPRKELNEATKQQSSEAAAERQRQNGMERLNEEKMAGRREEEGLKEIGARGKLRKIRRRLLAERCKMQY